MREGLRGHTIFSESNRRRLLHWTWTPSRPRGPMPVVVLLHGVYDAGGYCWWEKGGADLTASALVESGEVPPFCLVMPSDTGAEQGTGYCDWHDGTTFAETYVMRELLPWIAAELPSNGELHVAGLSMGGYGSLLLALRNPGTFAGASATSGFFDPLRHFRFLDDARARMWDGEAGIRAHDVRLLVQDPQRRRDLRIAFDCGVDDHLLEENREFHAHLEGLGIPHGYVERPGAHEWDYWTARLGEHLRFHLAGSGDLRPAVGAAAAPG